VGRCVFCDDRHRRRSRLVGPDQLLKQPEVTSMNALSDCGMRLEHEPGRSQILNR
jgi:hypothetical protein